MIDVTLPATWSSKRLKYLATYNDEVLPESTDEEAEIDYVEISGVSLSRGVEQVERITFGKAPSRARRKVRSGDILISTVRTYLRAIAKVDEASPDLIASTGFCVVRPDREEVDSGYLGWAAKSEPFVSEVVSRSVGVSYPAINASELVTIEMPLPPLETQRRIAQFLDEKTARIDGLIEKKRALLDRLAEKRQALITRAVTKGLNPEAPMKPSGIDWLGDIPAHWDLVPFKWRCQVQSGQVDPREPEYTDMPLIAPDYIESGTGRLYDVPSAEEQGAISGKYFCSEGSVLYSKIRPALRKVALFDSVCLCSADMYAIDPGKYFERRYLFYFLLTDAFTAYAELESLRVAMPKVNREALGAFVLPIPFLDEQTEIADYCSRVDRENRFAADEVKRSVQKLEEYRSALITAAVTGQIGGLQ
ncbi:restriction endonuclease subunit S [Alkalilimnicola ehrlichii MLHE-1]|uniref:Restriction modification system DNA specificity domain protein n=1 Tax=Alkalilimnicola ehrlichii (strain ATCC BAA-1101 / DSM 17681 / MLHE-1) TaxID=187272 RepID=Q0A7Q2_ALKEH|nr:restriction endonuclease subunit S [Alkalilimnicola ehrlichii]ABI57135.1 restriction modification system DNA specificity domain protein [Alkalilimnicola ehrlichii MLHE-1]